jgi:hypothetical protein
MWYSPDVCYFLSLKSKVVPVLNELSTTPWKRMGSGCIDPHFLDLGTSWRWAVNSRPGRFTPRERAPGVHWIGGWLDPRAGVDDVEKRKFLILPGLELQPLGRPARSQSLYRPRYPGFSIFFTIPIYYRILRQGERSIQSPKNNTHKYSIVNSLLYIIYYISHIRFNPITILAQYTQFNDTKDCSLARTWPTKPTYTREC